MLINGLFMSKLLYGITVWGSVSGIPGCPEYSYSGLTKRDILRIQALQNRVLRLIDWRDKYAPTKSLLEETKFLSINKMIAYQILLQCFKIKCSRKPEYHFQRLFRSNDDSTRTRSKEVKRVDFRLNIGRCSFFYQASRLWASLPSTLKNLTSTNSFKTETKIWISEKIPIKPI